MKNTAVDYLYQKLWDETKDKWAWQYYLAEAKEMEKSILLRYGFKYFMLGLSSAILGMLISKFI
jgi:hypothetical protein